MMSVLVWGLFLATAFPMISSNSDVLVLRDSNVPEGGPDMPLMRKTDLTIIPTLEKRIPSIHLETLSLATHITNQVIISESAGKTSSVNSYGDTVAVSLPVKVTCVDCYTTGTAVVSTTGITRNETLLLQIIDDVLDPTEIVVNALDLNIGVDLENLEGHFEIDIAFGAQASYTFVLFKTETEAGVEIDDGDKVGFVFTIELVFTASAQVDLIAGFDISFPQGASFALNPLNGHVESIIVDGLKVSSIPITYKSGSGCVSAIVRFKAQLGAAVTVNTFVFDFEAGLYLDMPQYKACVTDQPAQSCQVEFTEHFYEEWGAYAKAVEKLEFYTLDVAPTAVTTVYTTDLPSKCLVSLTSQSQLYGTSPPAVTPTPQLQTSSPISVQTDPVQPTPSPTPATPLLTPSPTSFDNQSSGGFITNTPTLSMRNVKARETSQSSVNVATPSVAAAYRVLSPRSLVVWNFVVTLLLAVFAL